MPDVSLGVGEPDFATPPQVVEEGVRSLRGGRTHYTSNYGTLELRRALASHLDRLYGLQYNPDSEIVVTVARIEAVAAAMAAIVDPGDEVMPRAIVRRVPAGHPVQRWRTRFRLDQCQTPLSSIRAESRLRSRHVHKVLFLATRATRRAPSYPRRSFGQSRISLSATTCWS